ncbi:MAG: cell division protein CrgA [Galactobacter sp.]
MPESTSRNHDHTDKAFADLAKIGNPAKRAEAEEKIEAKRVKAAKAEEFKPVATWYKVVMFGLMILGLLWIVTFYIAAMVGVDIPIPGIGNWNIMIGFGAALVGFIMMMGWRD